MAGDWIKMRSDLFTHPKVVRISSALKADTLRTVGGLMSAWCLFDAHSIDGRLDGYTAETLDDHLRWAGFAAAMIHVSWLIDDGESLALPEFDTHNGDSAKRRAQDADRKRIVRKMSASDTDKNRTREEKSREEKKEQKEQKEQKAAQTTAWQPLGNPPSPSPSPSLFPLLLLDDGTEFEVSETFATELRIAYPRIDLTVELAKMRVWLLANKAQRKTRKGTPRFINSWLSKATPTPTAATKPRRKLLGEGSSTNYGDKA